MDTINLAFNKLMMDRINNISIINFLKNNKIFSVDIIGNSVLVKGRSDRRWVYISSPNEDELYILKEKINKDDINFAAIEEWMIPILIDGRKMLWNLSAVQFYLPEDIHIPAPKCKSIPLKYADAQAVYENSLYKDYISMEYVIERIRKGVSAGLYENEKLVSWAMTQDDGAIGFLHTLDNYRKKGYGFNVTLSIVEKLRNKGKLPFAYIEDTNDKSMNLFSRLGFKENKNIHWFQVE